MKLVQRVIASLAHELLSENTKSRAAILSPEIELIDLPSAARLEQSLYRAGARYVAVGNSANIMHNLRLFLDSSIDEPTCSAI